MAWDGSGNVFLVGLSGNNPPTFDAVGIEIYKSTDGGQTWSAPNRIHASTRNDKQWATGDANPASPFHGRVYALWCDFTADFLNSRLRFARTLDQGATWVGTGPAATTPGTILAEHSFSPEINVASDGTIYIVSIWGSEIKLIVSTDGGDSFHGVQSPAKGVTRLDDALPTVHGWPQFSGGILRVTTGPTACVFGQTVAVAWADFRDHVSRIYYALSNDGGGHWVTGSSGKPLLKGTFPPNLQHFHPQIVVDPNGTFGCAFYEFGPKPVLPLIDVIMALSFDGGTSFNQFTVTDQPWNPSVDAPWSHHEDHTPIDSSVTFIGEYFGLDASSNGFFPLWTDTRTGIQELWTANVPEKKCAIIINRTLGQDEVDGQRKQAGGASAIVSDPFRVVVDGFAATQLGIIDSLSTLNVASPAAGMTINCTGNVAGNGDYGSEVQRFTFHYEIDFGPDDTAFGFAAATEFLTLTAAIASVSASAQIELLKQPDPFILHGDTSWLSVDLRVFVVRAGEPKFGATMGPDATAAPQFIQQVMANLTAGNGTAGGDPFDGLPTDESAKLFIYPHDNAGAKVFNFALAKVHYIGLIGAKDVRVFFRLFQAQSTTTAFSPTTTYRRADTNPSGHPIALAGIQSIGGPPPLNNLVEYVTIPCFATNRVDAISQSMTQQTDDANVQTFAAQADGSEVDRYFGCWLDINQPFKPDGTPNNVLPITPGFGPVDGPFGGTLTLSPTPLPIQQAIIRNPHQCLVAEIAFDPVAIPLGNDASNSDKLAQRNLAWSDVGSAQALSTFEIRPTRISLPPDQTPDELMIDWGNTPRGVLAQIYLPAVNIDDVLSMADRMYTSHRLLRVDDRTLSCRVGGITYVPIPRGGDSNFAGLLSIDMPAALQQGEVFEIVVRQITNAFGTVIAPPPGPAIMARREAAVAGDGSELEWRRVLGAFQLSIPVKTKAGLLRTEERTLSVLRWIAQVIPHNNRWYPVFHRYLHQIAGRVTSFGGDPTQIAPSPLGDGRRHHRHDDETEYKEGASFTGKIAGMIFDRFGDFEGFLLDTKDGQLRFFSRERDMEELAERAWRDRLRLTVFSDCEEPRRPLSIIVHEPPAPFHS